MNELDKMAYDVKDVYIDKQAVSAIKFLMAMDNASKTLRDQIENKLITRTFLDDIPTHEILIDLMKTRADELEKTCSNELVQAQTTKKGSDDLFKKIKLIKEEIKECIRQLDDFVEDKVEKKDPLLAEEEIKRIVANMNNSGDIIEEITDLAEDELDAINDLLETVLAKLFNSTNVSKLGEKIKGIQEKLEDLMQYISQTDKNSDEVR